MEISPISVLYVDDESDLLRIGKIFLEKNEDIRVDVSTSAKDALKLLQSELYDAIISDYHMPGMDGIAFLQEVRKNLNDIPFILFTGRGREEVVIQAINNGADFYLQKGGEPKAQFAELAHKIRQALRRKQAERAVRKSEKRLYDIIDFLPDPTFVIDTSGKVISWNKAMIDMTGISADEILLKDSGDIAPVFYNTSRPLLINLIDESEEDIQKYYSNVRRTDNALMAETDLVIVKGNHISVFIKVSRLYDENGEVSGAIESIRDITELKKAEKDLRKTIYELALAQEISHIGSWEYNPGTQVYRGSVEALSIFGYPPDTKDKHHDEIYRCIPDYEKVSQALVNLIREDTEYDLEYTVVPVDGSLPRFIHSLARVERNEQGDASRIIGVIQDITKRKQAEDELAFKNLILTTQQEVSPDAILIVDKNGIILGYNRNFVTIWNIPDDILVSGEDEPVLMFVASQPADNEAFISRVRYLYSHPEEKSFEEILLTDGRTLERFSSPMIGEDGTNFGRVWFFRDITERKQAERELEQKNQALFASYEQLAASEEELKAQFNELVEREQIIRINETRLLMAQDIGHTGCWEYNVQTDEIWGSAEGLSIFGFPKVAGDFPIKEIEDCIPERKRVHQALVDILTLEKPYDLEYEINPADGSPPRFIHSVARLEKDTDGHIIRVMGVIQDITQRKNRELILKETNEAFIQAQKIARVGSWIWNMKSGTVSCSDELYRVFGFEPGEIILDLETIRARIHPDDQKNHEIVLEHAIRTGLYSPEEYRILYPDNSIHFVNANGSVEMDADGTAIRIIGVCQDVTDQKQVTQEREQLIEDLGETNEELSATYETLLGTEQELKNQYDALAVSEEKLRQTNDYLENLFAIANVPIVIWDPSFRITRFNHAFELLTGRNAEEVIGQSIRVLLPPDQADNIMQLLRSTLKGERWDTTKIDVICQNGTIRTLIWNSATLFSPDGKTPVATIAQGHDITEEIRLEQEKDRALKQIQKNLAYLAILNDEIRNPLSIIVAYAELLDDVKTLDLISEQVHRIDQIVEHLDQRWMESEKVLNAIRKHYNLHVSFQDDEHFNTPIVKNWISPETVLKSGKRDEIQVKEAQAQLYAILDSFVAAVFVTDMDTNEILYINSYGKDHFFDLTDLPCYSGNTKNQDDRFIPRNYSYADELDSPDKTHQCEFFNPHNNAWYDCRNQVIRWGDGRMVRLVIVTDITPRKCSDKKIQELHEFQNAVISDARVWIMAVDKKGVVLLWNAAAEEISGYPSDEVVGSDKIWNLLNPDKDYLQQIIQIAKERIDTERGVDHFEATIRTIDGNQKIISWNLNAIRDDTGDIAGYTVIGIDITDWKITRSALEQQSSFLQVLIDTLPVPIFYKNRDGVYTGCNAAFEQYFGRSRNQVIGRTVYEFWPENEADVFYKADLSVFNSPHIQQYETEMQYADGSVHQVMFYKAPFFDDTGKVSGLVGAIIDITDQKRVEESLRESNQKLRLLTGLTRHDILNKLSAVQLLLDLALQSSDIAYIHQNISYALEAEGIIEKTIGFTREYEDFGTVSAGWYRIRPIIESAKKEVSPGEVFIDNQIPNDLTIYADPIIRKVFTTLLENAIRHGGKITRVSLSCALDSGNLIIACEDDGTGIPKEEKELIFEHGYGTNTGIGLFLSQEILSITRLSIRETGIYGKGARFEIFVPSGKFRFSDPDTPSSESPGNGI